MDYGKFDSAEELLRGYNELERSFTQKCQQLAALRAQTGAGNDKDANSSENPIIKTDPREDSAAEADPRINPSENSRSKTDLRENSAAEADPRVNPSENSSLKTDLREDSAATNPRINPSENSSLKTNPREDGSAETNPSVKKGRSGVPDQPPSPLTEAGAAVPACEGADSPSETPEPLPPRVMSGGGYVSAALPSRPKTLREASELAKKILESQESNKKW